MIHLLAVFLNVVKVQSCRFPTQLCIYVLPPNAFTLASLSTEMGECGRQWKVQAAHEERVHPHQLRDLPP